jgi:putative ABC transport system ATP-binding protein
MVAMSETDNKLPANQKDLAYALLEKFGIVRSKADRLVNQLSGGEQQRVAIARSLSKNVNLIFADEPTGNLDSETSRNIFNLFKRLSKQCLVIIVTHDEESALEFADMIVNISPDGDSLKEVKTNA